MFVFSRVDNLCFTQVGFTLFVASRNYEGWGGAPKKIGWSSQKILRFFGGAPEPNWGSGGEVPRKKYGGSGGPPPKKNLGGGGETPLKIITVFYIRGRNVFFLVRLYENRVSPRSFFFGLSKVLLASHDFAERPQRAERSGGGGPLWVLICFILR